jgi:hypothetical protein
MTSPHVLAIVFSPANVICALGATLHGYSEDAHLTLGVCDWPGMSAAENRDRLETFRRMTSQIPFVRAVVPLTDEMAAEAARSPSVNDLMAEVKTWLAHPIDEIQYSHDLLGAVYQLTCMAWPRARRVSFGDGFGHIGTKEDYLSQQQEHKGPVAAWRAKRTSLALRMCNRARFELARRHMTSPPSAKDILFRPHEFRLFLPVNDFGYRAPSRKLRVLPRSLFIDVWNLIRRSTSVGDYERELIIRAGSRPAVILATENYVESGLLTMEQEIPMWLDMLAAYLAGRPLIVVKPHPGERQARWPILAERLVGRAAVCEFAHTHQRLPLEVFTGLIGRFTFVTSAFLRVSLNYLHGLTIPNPMTDAMIESYFPEWFRPHIRKAARDQDGYIAALGRWDGAGMLYPESESREHSTAH